ncbi:sodium-dependent bicarbonate transport family permease [bacterium]|nr:sodium-dependent bicarbonate transport family permease [bacterium]
MQDPIILFFILGVFAGLIRSELRLPTQVYEFVTIILLLSIGLKGGMELSSQPILKIAPQIIAVIGMGILLPFIAFSVLRFIGKLSRPDAASIAAHYGSVSVGTYAVAIAFMSAHSVYFEEHIVLLLAVLEVPAIIVGILLARGISNQKWTDVFHEIFSGKGIVLLFGGLVIGAWAGKNGLTAISPLFFDCFKGILALFLLEMGLLAASKIGALRQYGLFLLFFGIGMALFSSVVGITVGILLGLSPGGTAMLAVMAASASYIAVPAAMRISVPEANPALSLTASLGVTFPFNVLIGIPLYYHLTLKVLAMIGR